eukprot:TRINITY_DN58946_c0_g1_i1.p1 TRINITY_DN58946_c0_g1~~TRINITY_DN58946_c0_g1_i1.p1  ORF type:complete len:232 (+),score=22.29 TRINITY_DN58946_c0_g1_i1:73-696(+)
MSRFANRVYSRNGILLCAPVLVQIVSAHSAIEIIGKLKTFRDGAENLFEKAASAMEKDGHTLRAAKVRAWSDDWLSLFSFSKGIPGLSGDFAMNYLGRNAYHKRNGNLVSAIQRLESHGSTWKDFREGLLNVCTEGKKVFKSEGCLHSMLRDLNSLLKDDGTAKYFEKAFRKALELKRGFHFLGGEDTGNPKLVLKKHVRGIRRHVP